MQSLAVARRAWSTSTGTATRRLLHASRSTQNQKSQAPSQTLPDAKLRLMISLHHQAKHFITPENLDMAIINAFAPEVSNGSDQGVYRVSMKDLYTRMSNSKAEVTDSRDSQYYGTRFELGYGSNRKDEISSALFGTEAQGVQLGLPGLEVVREETAAAEQLAAEAESQKS
ncbi:hypothetical protein DL93DRAFT_2081721 [Clavulina sp. PMI_390]|nr:hypothetical protein DL93DRAFT_2081721 [Clavulina sp. PMI_390]